MLCLRLNMYIAFYHEKVWSFTPFLEENLHTFIQGQVKVKDC